MTWLDPLSVFWCVNRIVRLLCNGLHWHSPPFLLACTSYVTPTHTNAQPVLSLLSTNQVRVAATGMNAPWGRGAGLTISAKFRRNFGKFSVSASYRDPKFRYFSVYFVSKFKIQQISSEIHRNSPKFTEISERNSVSGKHRDLTGKRKGEP